MVRPPQIVDDFMTSLAHPINENATIQQSKNKMKELNTNFLVVTKDNKPKYILREADIAFKKPNDTIVGSRCILC